MDRAAIDVPDLDVAVGCGGGRHVLQLRGGRWVELNHDVVAERTLVALGADVPWCLLSARLEDLAPHQAHALGSLDLFGLEVGRFLGDVSRRMGEPAVEADDLPGAVRRMNVLAAVRERGGWEQLARRVLDLGRPRARAIVLSHAEHRPGHLRLGPRWLGEVWAPGLAAYGSADDVVVAAAGGGTVVHLQVLRASGDLEDVTVPTTAVDPELLAVHG